MNSSELAEADQSQMDSLVGKIIVPLQLACESRLHSLMSMALDCFQVRTIVPLFCWFAALHAFPPKKLLLYGYINGAAVDIEQPDKKLIERVLFVINSCFQKRKGEKGYPDDNVQLQILKVRPARCISGVPLIFSSLTILRVFKRRCLQPLYRAKLTYTINCCSAL